MSRLIASRIINDVTCGRSLSDCFESTLPHIKDPRDRAFVQALCYGVCRYYPRLDFILSCLLEKPMREKDADVHALLMVGLYQLMAMRTPDYAAVAETVNASAKLNKPWSRGLTNAILREYLREREGLEKEIQKDEEALYAHPDWIIRSLKKAYPSQWQAILAANNEHPPFSLRVNQQKISREKYLEKLQAEHHPAHIIPETKSGLIVDTPFSAEELPGFAQGEIFVQDGAAQLAAEILEPGPGMRVLDACAAPGGKLTHLLEIMPDATVIAVEKEASRLSSIKENLHRLNMQAECMAADVNDVNKWWDGQLFDRILLDAPCSASGVIRRHPDIKLLRSPADIPAFAREQKKLLESLWPLLKKDGLLLYATCSIFPEENTQVLQAFLASHPDASELPISVKVGMACPVGRQILPDKMDGFYYGILKKT